jgi:hypothetical protein
MLGTNELISNRFVFGKDGKINDSKIYIKNADDKRKHAIKMFHKYKSKSVALIIEDYDDLGLLKMDFLGLKTLSIIKDAVSMIEKNHGVKLDVDEVPLEDEETYQLFQRGETVGIFLCIGLRPWLRMMFQPGNAFTNPFTEQSLRHRIGQPEGEEVARARLNPVRQSLLGDLHRQRVVHALEGH